ncbi:hypothetical protein GJAV_G00255430 [Gymnothorax javanicus]|nr:hypothetical protein GJAV_G00255430 [Gymnothorax javanicus]
MKIDPGAPADRGLLVGVIFFILGLGTLLPWNFFMTAITYFQTRLNTTEWSNGTALPHKEYHFGNWLTLLSQLPLLLFTLLNSFLYQQVSEKMRIAGSLVCILLLFMLNASLVRVPMENDCFFSVTMATIWFINSFGAVMQGSLFGLVGQFPLKYSVFFMSGQGVAGTFATIAMLIAISSGSDPDTAALGYFITPCGGTVVTLSCYLLLPHLPFARYYFNKGKGIDTDSKTPPLPEDTPLLKHAKQNGYSGHSIENQQDVDDHLSYRDSDSDRQALIPQERPNTEGQVPPKNPQSCTSLSRFGGRWEIYFIPVCCFLNFNIMDWLSRTATSVIQWPAKDSVLFPILVVGRLVFIPLIMLCNVQYRSHLPVIFVHDAAFAAIMMLFSFSSGYFVCLTMSYAPMMVEPKDAETAGALMTFFLALGLSLGAGLSFPLRALV